MEKPVAGAQGHANNCDDHLCLWLLITMRTHKWPRFLFPSGKKEKCLRRTKGGKKKKERKKKTQQQLSGVAFLMKPFFPTVLPPKWEESRGKQEGGILYSDDSKEDFHSCDDGM